MRRIVLLALPLLFTAAAYPQALIERDIEANNVRARLTNAGTLFWNGVNSKYEVPKVPAGQIPKSTIFAASPWMGGYSNGQLYLFAETFHQSIARELQQGPVATNYSGTRYDQWARIWGVTPQQISDFQHDFVSNKPNLSTYTDILEWPAHGDVTKGEAANLAPFVDVNGDGKYNPMQDGDYPLIKGDQYMYTIMNDETFHGESSGNAMKVEIHRAVYAYTNSAVENTLFIDYRIINRSSRTYDSTVFGSWMDFDLGNPLDDYIGTDSLKNMVYAFNGDPDDDGMLGYGTNPPAQACVLIGQKMMSSKYYNNTFDEVSGNARLPRDYYLYMRGRWKDGSPVTVGDSGQSGTVPTNYTFSGDPCSNAGWWEGSAGQTPGDRRILASTGAFRFAPGDEFRITLALVYARDNNGGSNIGSVCKLQTAVDAAVSFYNSQPHTGIAQAAATKATFSMYPNPSDDIVQIRLEQAGKANSINIINSTGQLIRTYEGMQQVALSKAEIGKGLFFVQVSDGKTGSTKKLIIE